ncbi:MAG: hypothetical protein AAB686_01835 [Patescibacteria group bacterium]
MFSRKQLIIYLAESIGRALLVAVLAVMLIGFLRARIAHIGNSINEQRVTSLILEKKTESVIQLRRDLARIGDAQTKILNALLPLEDILVFQDAVNSSASQFSLQPGFGFGNFSDTAADFSLSLSGGFPTLLRYLKSFEAMPYFMDMSSVQLSFSGASWEENMRIGINGRVYTRGAVPVEASVPEGQ